MPRPLVAAKPNVYIPHSATLTMLTSNFKEGKSSCRTCCFGRWIGETELDFFARGASSLILVGRTQIVMARHGRQKPAEVGVSDDELPELSTLLEGSKNEVAAEIKHRLKGRMMETSSATRTSPRRRGTLARSTHKPAELQVASVRGLSLGTGIPA